MKKGAIAVEQLARYALIGVGVAILLFIVFPAFSKIFAETVAGGECEWSLVVSALTKVAGAEMIPPECKAHRFIVKKEDFLDSLDDAKKRLKVIVGDKKYEGATQVFKNTEPETVKEFALDKIIAKEMLDCSNKVMQGKLPLFREWWGLLNCKEGGKTRKCKLEDFATINTAIAVFYPAYGAASYIYQRATGQITHPKPPTFCIVCSRIQFDPALLQEEGIGGRKITSLTEWMKINRPKRSPRSYYEDVVLWQTGATGLFAPKYEYDVMDTYAVVYTRINVHKIQQWLEWAASVLGKEPAESINKLWLVPYKQENLVVFDPLTGGLGCNFILD